jgi:hypothetical protein
MSNHHSLPSCSRYAEAYDIADEHCAWLGCQMSAAEAMDLYGIIPQADGPRWEDVVRHVARRWLTLPIRL